MNLVNPVKKTTVIAPHLLLCPWRGTVDILLSLARIIGVNLIMVGGVVLLCFVVEKLEHK